MEKVRKRRKKRSVVEKSERKTAEVNTPKKMIRAENRKREKGKKVIGK